MDKAFYHCLSLPELFAFLLLDAAIALIGVLWTFSVRFLVRPSRNGNAHDRSTKERELVSREDIEVVMEAMGMSIEPNEGLGLHKLSAMFEECEPSMEEAWEAFSVFDMNRDGFIDAAELLRVLEKLGIAPGVELRACQSMIAERDVNGDGRIDFSEFVRFMESSF